MARSWTLLTALVLLASVCGPAGGGDSKSSEQPPLWPLDLSTHYLTGNFMEPRSGRFHTGLDIKTNSRTGYAVVAVRDGWVSRVKCDVGGYGKAIYLTGDDGMVYVYGHLERMQDRLRRRVGLAQARQGRYPVDLVFEPDDFPVGAGEVLALSGQSATTGPHLHFEVRGPDGRPRDPLAHGFAVADTIAPEILAVRAVNLAGPAVGGMPSSLVIGDGRAALRGRLPELHLSHGKVRFSARIVERSDLMRYRLGPWRVQLLRDGQPVYGADNDVLSWSDTRQERLEHVRSDLGQERWLWRDLRTTLAGRTSTGWLEAAALPPGRHDLRLVAEDRAGNRAEVAWTVVIAGPGATANPGWRPDGEVWPDSWELTVAGAVPRQGELTGTDPVLSWRRGQVQAPAPTRWLRLAGLEPVGLPVQFRTAGPALLDTRTLVWPALPESERTLVDDPAVAVYRLDDAQWDYAAPLIGGAFELDAAGVYGLWRDVAAPVVATAAVTTEIVQRGPTSSHGISLPGWPVLRVPVGDHGSGIAWDSLHVQLDGAVLVVEPDAPRDRILVEFPDAIRPGKHRLDIFVADRAGHEIRAGLDLTLRAVTSATDTSSP